MLYEIADLVIDVETTTELLSFRPFVVSEGQPIMSYTEGKLPAEVRDAIIEMPVMDKFSNDAGDVVLKDAGEHYLVEVTFGGPLSYMLCKKDFSEALAEVNDATNESILVSSMLRMAFSQRILFFEGFSIHSSVVVKDYKGYLFLGKSGTGKSTHTRLWMQTFSDAWLLNDDNPMVRFSDGELKVYGSPWSGKTPCYRNASVPVGGIVRLSQAKTNLWNYVSGAIAWVTIFPSCSLISRDEVLYLQSQNTLNRVVSEVKVGQLACLPDKDAVVLCFNKLTNEGNFI